MTSGPKVLVVDDDRSLRTILALHLTDEGYRVLAAEDGGRALELVAREHPQAILLDMRMPGMDGWEFSRRYRERYDHEAPLIAFSAATDVAVYARQIGAEFFLGKPFDVDRLLEVLAAAVGRVGQA